MEKQDTNTIEEVTYIENINRVIMELAFLTEVPETEQKISSDLGIDSLKKVEMIVRIEQLLDVELPLEALDPSLLNTVSDVYCLFEKYVVK